MEEHLVRPGVRPLIEAAGHVRRERDRARDLLFIEAEQRAERRRRGDRACVAGGPEHLAEDGIDDGASDLGTDLISDDRCLRECCPGNRTIFRHS